MRQFAVNLRELLGRMVNLPSDTMGVVSFHQYMSGLGTPFPVQSRVTVWPWSTLVLRGGSIPKDGSAEITN